MVFSVACVERKATDTQQGVETSATVQSTAVEPESSAARLRSLGIARVALIDTTMEGEPGDIGSTLYRIRVTTGTRIDTIPGVRTMTMPGVGADGKVYLFSYDDGGFLLAAHQYDPNTRRLTQIQLPPDVGVSGAQIMTSPDARHIAYMTPPSSTSPPYGLVRSWPDGKLVDQTPAEPWREEEVDSRVVRWLDANRAEFLYASGRVNRWIHAIVTLHPRAVKVDSLESQPEWAR